MIPAGAAAAAGIGVHAEASVVAAYTLDGGVKAPCFCCNTLTSPGDRCRARRVLTRAKSRVVPCRLDLADTPGLARQQVDMPATPLTPP
jgi:hypothetical protein